MLKKLKHSTSAGGFVVNSKNQIALVHQSGKFWAWPKGHIRKGETKLEAAKREIYEETGIRSENLAYIRDLGHYERCSVDNSSELKMIYLFLFKSDQERLQPIDLKELKAKWIDKNKVEKLLGIEKDKEYFREIFNKIK